MNLKPAIKQLRRERAALEKRQEKVEYVLDTLERLQRRPYQRHFTNNGRKKAA